MNPTSSEGIANRETAADLKAAIEARRELGPDMEDPVIDAFLARLEQRLEARSGAMPVPQKSKPPAQSKDGGTRRGHSPLEVVVGSLALSIPLMAVAGDAGGTFAVVAVMFTVLAINLFYFIDRWAH